MSEYPTFMRNNATLYTTLMSAEENYFLIKIWNMDRWHEMLVEDGIVVTDEDKSYSIENDDL